MFDCLVGKPTGKMVSVCMRVAMHVFAQERVLTAVVEPLGVERGWFGVYVGVRAGKGE